LALEQFKMSLLRSSIGGGLFFYKDAAPTGLKQKAVNGYQKIISPLFASFVVAVVVSVSVFAVTDY